MLHPEAESYAECPVDVVTLILKEREEKYKMKFTSALLKKEIISSSRLYHIKN